MFRNSSYEHLGHNQKVDRKLINNRQVSFNFQQSSVLETKFWQHSLFGRVTLKMHLPRTPVTPPLPTTNLHCQSQTICYWHLVIMRPCSLSYLVLVHLWDAGIADRFYFYPPFCLQVFALLGNFSPFSVVLTEKQLNEG